MRNPTNTKSARERAQLAVEGMPGAFCFARIER